MKYTIILFLLLCAYTNAQETATIKVSGTVNYIDPNPLFEAIVSLGTTYSSLPSEAVSLEQMKTNYLEALYKKGLDTLEVKEDSDAYEYLGYEKKGTIYRYETKSLADYQKFMSTKTFGIQRLSYGCSSILDEKMAGELSKKAIANARALAESIAKGMGKKLGEAVQVIDRNEINYKVFTSLYYDRKPGENIYRVEVAFSLKE